MRIVTWNCARGPFAAKRAALAALAPDIVVLTEASPPTSGDANVSWFGEGRYGVAIYATDPFCVRLAANTVSTSSVYPVLIDGPVSFSLFGIWTRPAPTYRAALLNGLTAHTDTPMPWVVAGDFNGNVDFDRPRSREKWQHCFDHLGEMGLASAYHSFSKAPYGHERDATHYFRWHEAQPFHIDYCFVPKEWTIQSVTVGSYSEWAKLSDHRPVIVDIAPT